MNDCEHCDHCTFGRHDNCVMEKVSIRDRITTYAGTPGEHYRCGCAATDHGTTRQHHLLAEVGLSEKNGAPR